MSEIKKSNYKLPSDCRQSFDSAHLTQPMQIIQ